MAKFGVPGLLICTLMAGAMLVLMGLTGLGAAVRFIPRAVTIGFTNGIALLIASTQLKDFFGLSVSQVPSEFAERMAVLAGHAGTVSPRRTPRAAAATVHLAPRVGTNVALLNGLLHRLIEGGHVDRKFVDKHTDGFAKLEATVKDYPPRRVRQITGVPEARLCEAADVIGTARTLVSLALQGVYQSNQATAAACQINNINVVLGQIGRSGARVFQSNGQPTAPEHPRDRVRRRVPVLPQLAEPPPRPTLGRPVERRPLKMPHCHDHAHAMELFRHVETGSVRFLWVVGTNPAVSLPELHRVRKVLGKTGLFLRIFRRRLVKCITSATDGGIWGIGSASPTPTLA